MSAAIQDIAQTLRTLATPGMKPKDLFAAVRKQHPDATKKEVSRAAFFAVIQEADSDPERAKGLQEMALASRGAGESETPGGTTGKRGKKTKN